MIRFNCKEEKKVGSRTTYVLEDKLGGQAEFSATAVRAMLGCKDVYIDNMKIDSTGQLRTITSKYQLADAYLGRGVRDMLDPRERFTLYTKHNGNHDSTTTKFNRRQKIAIALSLEISTTGSGDEFLVWGEGEGFNQGDFSKGLEQYFRTRGITNMKDKLNEKKDLIDYFDYNYR